jgi:hypothetical protein
MTDILGVEEYVAIDQFGSGAVVLRPCENAVLGRNVALEVDAGRSPSRFRVNKRLPYIRNAPRLGGGGLRFDVFGAEAQADDAGGDAAENGEVAQKAQRQRDF